MQMKSTLTLRSGGHPMTAEVHAPSGKPRGLVVIAYGSDGLTDGLSGPWKTMIEGYAAALAGNGFSAVIPDYLSVTATPPGPAVFDAMSGCGAGWQAAILDAADRAIAVLKVDPGRVGLLGFSLGGHLALRLRAKARVLVEFFAPVLDGIGAPGALTHAQIHHGKEDRVPGTGFANAAAIEDTLRREGTATELYPYAGAGHGFIGADQANRTARDLSKARTLSFFQAHL
jgi:dienelactone hydrolase